MTDTPTPRTNATFKAIVAMLEPLRGGSRVTDEEMKSIEGVITALAKCAVDLEGDLAARDASLRYVRETLDAARPGMDEGAPIEAIVRKVAAELAAANAAVKDAERYRWLRDNRYIYLGPVLGRDHEWKHRYVLFGNLRSIPAEIVSVDDAIDAAREGK